MLEIVRYNEEEYTFPCLLVLGCFDGLHIGHQDLLKKAKLQAKINGLDLGVMMFADGKGGKQLYTFEERVKFLEDYNVKFVLQIDFNDDFKQIKPLDFLACIEDKLNVKAYMSGKDFRFGQGKKGKSSTLKSYAEDEDNGVWYTSVKDVVHGDEKVSTTGIKSLLEAGNVTAANELLGRNYTVSGTVINGADRGGKVIGFPTMNIQYPAQKFEVKRGVYAVKCKVGDTEYDGIANYGERPTFDESAPLLEVYLKDFGGEHYGEEITVGFVSYIRDIAKFDSAEALAQQLECDLSFLSGEAEPVKELAVAEASAPEEATNQETVEEVVSETPVAEATAEEPVEETAPQEVIEEAVVEDHVSEEKTVQPDEDFEAELNEIDDENAEITEEPQKLENCDDGECGEAIPKVSDEIDEAEVDAGEFDMSEFMAASAPVESDENQESDVSDETVVEEDSDSNE